MPRRSKRRFRKTNRSSRARRRLLKKMRGGVKISFAKPRVNQVTSNSAIQGAIYEQKESNDELTTLNKEMSGGGLGTASSEGLAAAEGQSLDGPGAAGRGSPQGEVIVPQMNQAEGEGNDTMAGSIATQIGGEVEAEYDSDVTKGPAKSTYKGGRRRRRTRRKRRRKRRKSRRKSRRKKHRTRRRRRRRK